MGSISEISCAPWSSQPLSSDTQIALFGVTRVLASVGEPLSAWMRIFASCTPPICSTESWGKAFPVR